MTMYRFEDVKILSFKLKIFENKYLHWSRKLMGLLFSCVNVMCYNNAVLTQKSHFTKWPAKAGKPSKN